MTATRNPPMPSPHAEFPRPRRVARWLLPAALFAVMPKCALCVLAYAGLGAAFGLGGREICGGSANSTVSWLTSLAWIGLAGVLGTIGCLASCRRAHRVPTHEM